MEHGTLFMNKFLIFISTFITTAILSANLSFAHGVPMNASTYIISPSDGQTVSSPVTVKFGIRNFKISPTGEDIYEAGHFHLIIDSPAALSLDEPIPYDKNHLHFDSAEKAVLLTLDPGKHTLQLIVGDEEHEPYDQLVSKIITINVK